MQNHIRFYEKNEFRNDTPNKDLFDILELKQKIKIYGILYRWFK